MGKKVLAVFLATLVLFAAVGIMCFKYMIPKSYPVFIESFAHGKITVDEKYISEDDDSFDEKKYKIDCKKGSSLTIQIEPYRKGSKYYNLKKLVVNGVDVTDEVNEDLSYTVEVDRKLTILAYFKKGTKPDTSKTTDSTTE